MKLSVSVNEIYQRPESSTKLMSELDMYVKSMESLDPSSEGFVDAFKSFLTSSVDVLTRFTRPIRELVSKTDTHGPKTMLSTYMEVNKAAMQKVDALTFDKIMNVLVDFPTGMKTSYTGAVNTICDAYRDVDATNTLIANNDVVITVYNSLNENDLQKALNAVLEASKKAARHIKLVQTSHDKLWNIVSTSDTMRLSNLAGKKEVFKNLYLTMEEFRAVTDKILGFKVMYSETTTIINKVDTIAFNCDKIPAMLAVESFNSTDVKLLVKELQSVIKYLASVTETYGIMTQDALAVEHNHLMVLKFIASIV